MCGIVGWAGSDPGVGSRLQQMTDALRHRGPDAGAVMQWHNGGLGFRRLALVDLVRGDQPVSDERARYWSVFNGELYNHVELRRDLLSKGHRPTGFGDADLVPHLYEEYGPAFVLRLRGMFAIAVHDRHTGGLFLARDPFGIKPLYWTARAGTLVFASEVRALRATGWVASEPDPQAVWHYLTFGYVPDPGTMWEGVHALPAGHTLTLLQGTATVRRWWTPRPEPRADLTLEQAAHDVLAAVDSSVQAHLAADVPVGSYLSSGVDSSLLAALAVRHQELHTFSIGFHNSQAGQDEVAAARSLASTLGTVHHEELVSAAEYWQHLPEIVGAQEQPLADPSAPALWFLARAASREVKAVLSGEGADELFGGYPIYQEPRALRPVTALPRSLRTGLGRWASGWPVGRPGRSFLRRGAMELPERFPGNAPVFSDEAKDDLWAAEGPRRPSWSVLDETYERSAGLDDVLRMQLASIQGWLPNSILMKADKMSMAHSLEVRVPFLDRVVYDVAASLPPGLRVQGGQTKVALRAAAALVLPAEVAQRPKLGFPIPFRAWLRGGVEDEVRSLLHDTPDALLEPTAVLALLEPNGDPAQDRHLWSVMTYLLWKQAQLREDRVVP